MKEANLQLMKKVEKLAEVKAENQRLKKSLNNMADQGEMEDKIEELEGQNSKTER